MGRSAEFREGFMAGSRSHLAALRARIGHKSGREVPLPVPDASMMNAQQRRVLPFAVIAALVLGLILIAHYVTIILLAFLAAVIFYPLYKRILRKNKRPGTAATLTFIITLLLIIIPLVFTVIITFGQLKQIIDQLTAVSHSVPLPDSSSQLLDWINNFLGSLTHGSVQITAQDMQDAVASVALALASFFLTVLSNSFSGIANFVTQFILYMFLFTGILTHADSLQRVFKAINPLGNETSTLYLRRAGQMAKGAVGGQFLIAFCQGFAEAAVLYIAGLHYFFFFALVLSFLSIIPLGGGILAIPIGIIMILTGDVWQGVFVLGMHFTVIVNIDNVLRPRLVPKSIRMNSALMLLAVFGGLGLFGFIGIAIGPIIMILVLTTIQIYLPVAEASHARPSKSPASGP
jgi:predicted PurR-regulated permease PerM